SRGWASRESRLRGPPLRCQGPPPQAPRWAESSRRSAATAKTDSGARPAAEGRGGRVGGPRGGRGGRGGGGGGCAGEFCVCVVGGRASVGSFGSEPGRKDVRSAIIARLRFRRLDSGKLVPKGEFGSKDKLDGSSQPSEERLAPKAYHKKDGGNRDRRVCGQNA